MNHNEGRETFYRMHDSQIPQSWMDPENLTAFHISSVGYFFFNYLKTYYFFRIFSLLEYIFKSFELNKRNIIADNSCFSSASAL